VSRFEAKAMKPNKDILTSVVSAKVLQSIDLDPQREREDILSRFTDKPFVAPRVISAFVRVLESLLVAAVAIFALWRFPGFERVENLTPFLGIITIAAVAFPTMMQVIGAYSLSFLLNPFRRVTAVAVIWALMFGGIAVAIFATKLGDDLSRNWFMTWAISGLLFVLGNRFMLAELLRKWNREGQLNRRAVLVGGGAPAEHVIATLDASRDTGITLLGIFDDRGDDRAPLLARGLPKLGSIENLIDFVRSTRVDTLIITLPVTAENRLLHILKRLWVLPVDIRLSAQDQLVRYRPRAYSYIGNLALLDLFDRPLGDWGPFLKTIEDRVIAAIAIVLLAPVFLAVAIAVKWESKGPAFFRQKRYGFNNELIEVYKFRSMFTDMADVNARTLVTKDDPRVTRVGRIIRRTSLDELPQLINVLKGELSLVGPRPHATMASAAGNLYETVVDGYFARHKVKPGMTGWAQINGWRGETDTKEKIERRVEHDLYYIENWSLTFDLYILARTPFALLNTKGAY
jgi:Undecaprenyl-phosphate glucose phosphotransferase